MAHHRRAYFCTWRATAAGLSGLQDGLRFFAPSSMAGVPAWDCLPYDRLSPLPTSVADGSERLSGWPPQETPARRPASSWPSAGAALQRCRRRLLRPVGGRVCAGGQNPRRLVADDVSGARTGYAARKPGWSPGSSPARRPVDLFPPARPAEGGSTCSVTWARGDPLVRPISQRSNRWLTTM